MKLENIHSECQRCANLKAWNIHMNGDHDYCCRCKPSSFISKDLHWEPCEKFADHLFSHEINYKEEEGIEDIYTIYLVENNDTE